MNLFRFAFRGARANTALLYAEALIKHAEVLHAPLDGEFGTRVQTDKCLSFAVDIATEVSRMIPGTTAVVWGLIANFNVAVFAQVTDGKDLKIEKFTKLIAGQKLDYDRIGKKVLAACNSTDPTDSGPSPSRS